MDRLHRSAIAIACNLFHGVLIANASTESPSERRERTPYTAKYRDFLAADLLPASFLDTLYHGKYNRSSLKCNEGPCKESFMRTLCIWFFVGAVAFLNQSLAQTSAGVNGLVLD